VHERGPDRRQRRPATTAATAGATAAPGDDTRFVKVRADKLDHLIDLIGELVIAGSGAQMVANLEGSTRLPGSHPACQRPGAGHARRRAGLRMVPVGETFSRFQRVVRDTSKQLGKEIELVVTGGDTELDKSMVEPSPTR
jgi:two-component system chemotaxis sensor kinase CheA